MFIVMNKQKGSVSNPGTFCSLSCCSSGDCGIVETCVEGQCIQRECDTNLDSLGAIIAFEEEQYGTQGRLGQTALLKCKEGQYNQKYPLRTRQVIICSEAANSSSLKWIGIDGAELVQCSPGIIILSVIFCHPPTHFPLMIRMSIGQSLSR